MTFVEKSEEKAVNNRVGSKGKKHENNKIFQTEYEGKEVEHAQLHTKIESISASDVCYFAEDIYLAT